MLTSHAATPTEAQAFAKAGKLTVRNVAPLGDDTKPGEATK
jgi:hypothetical protein